LTAVCKKLQPEIEINEYSSSKKTTRVVYYSSSTRVLAATLLDSLDLALSQQSDRLLSQPVTVSGNLTWRQRVPRHSALAQLSITPSEW